MTEYLALQYNPTLMPELMGAQDTEVAFSLTLPRGIDLTRVSLYCGRLYGGPLVLTVGIREDKDGIPGLLIKEVTRTVQQIAWHDFDFGGLPLSGPCPYWLCLAGTGSLKQIPVIGSQNTPRGPHLVRYDPTCETVFRLPLNPGGKPVAYYARTADHSWQGPFSSGLIARIYGRPRPPASSREEGAAGE